MKRASILSACLLLLAVASIASAATKYPEQWNMCSANLSSDAGMTQFIDLLKLSKEAGCTHILMGEGKWYNTPDNPAYLARVVKVKAAAKEMNLTLVPTLYALGYSGRYLGGHANLAAGLPVKDEPFLVKGTTAQVDPSLAIDASSLKADDKGNIDGRLKARPFTHYRISFQLKNEWKGDADELVRISTDKDNKRWVTRSFPCIYKDGDKILVQTTFNTLELDTGDMRVQVMAPCENIKIEPIGAWNMVRRELTPLKVTSADGKTVYEEGKDFKPFADPKLLDHMPDWTPLVAGPMPTIVGPVLELTATSRIKDGDKLLVSFFHAYRIYGDQDQISMEDPEVFKLMETDAANCVKVWDAAGYFMNYDEIRIAGWENQPDGKHLSPGQILAAHVKKGYDLIRSRAPKATIYTWSDMFSPFENAYSMAPGKRYYYLVNVTWEGADAGLPKDTVIFSWAAQDSAAIKFFSDRGQKQVLCGFYDGKTEEKMKVNIAKWLTISKGSQGILGFMYTTWTHDFVHMKPYFQLLETSDTWMKDTTTKKFVKEGPIN